MFIIVVDVMFKFELFDLQGKVVFGVFVCFGVEGFIDVCIGKCFEFIVEGEVIDEVFVEVCCIVDEVFLNFVIEDVVGIEVVE